MNTRQCTKCGKERLATSLNDEGVCLVCAPKYDVTSRSSSTLREGSDQIGESSSRAIEVVGTVNSLNAIAGAILTIVAIAFGIDLESMAAVGVGLVIALVTLVTWALNRMFIGIAQDIKAIRAKVESS